MRSTAGPQAVHVFVERQFARPDALHEASAGLAGAGPCLALHRVQVVETSVSENGERLMCHLIGPDVETVRRILSRYWP
jgi:hypothetical protein